MNKLLELYEKETIPAPLERKQWCKTSDMYELIQRIGQDRCKGFIIDEKNEQLYQGIAGWLSGEKELKGMYIAGPTGTGKSYAMNVMRVASSLFPGKYKVYGEEEYIEVTIRNAQDICSMFASTGDIQSLVQLPFLVINDLGAEIVKYPSGEYKSEVVYMGTRCNVLKSLLEMRGDKETLVTFITSNYRIDSKVLKEVYGERVLSRLKQMCDYYILNGLDRRNQQ